MGAMASQITTIVYSTVHSGADQRKHQSSASLAFVRGIHQWHVNSPPKWPVTRKMLPFDDVIMINQGGCGRRYCQIAIDLSKSFCHQFEASYKNTHQNINKPSTNGIEWVLPDHIKDKSPWYITMSRRYPISVSWRHQAFTWTNVDLSIVRLCVIYLMAPP